MAATKMFGASVFRNIPAKEGLFRSIHQFVRAKYAQTISKLPETNITTLSNGLRVASSQTDSPTSTVGVWIDSGSRYESPETNGTANFFEHLLLKGNSAKSRADIEREILNMGAQFHAETGREKTSLYSKCLSSDVPKAVEILGNAVGNTDFDDTQVEIERKVILSELEEIQANDPKQVTFDYLHLTAYQDTPLSRSVYGPTENIKKITKNDIANYAKSNFAPAHIVLVGSGNIKHQDLVKLAEKHFGSLSQGGPSTLRSTCRFTGSDVRARDDWMPFAHVAIAVDTCGAGSPDIIPLTLAKTVIGSWDKSSLSSAHTTNVLTQNIYKEKGCHRFESFHNVYHDTGLWGCYFVMDKMVIDDFVFNLQNEWMKLCITLSNSELDMAKNKLRNELLHKLNDTTLHCADIGQQILDLGEHIPFAVTEAAIDSVSLDQLKSVCYKYIFDRCPAVSGVGPIEGLTDYLRIRGNMCWVRY